MHTWYCNNVTKNGFKENNLVKMCIQSGKQPSEWINNFDKINPSSQDNKTYSLRKQGNTPWGTVAEWLMCQLLDLQVADPSGAT